MLVGESRPCLSPTGGAADEAMLLKDRSFGERLRASIANLGVAPIEAILEQRRRFFQQNTRDRPRGALLAVA